GCPVPDTVGVKDEQVRGKTGLDPSSRSAGACRIVEPQGRCGKSAHLPDSLFQPKKALLSHIAVDDACKTAVTPRVAHGGAAIGADHHHRIEHEPPHHLLVHHKIGSTCPARTDL